ncbi:DUF3987 domain-containing protein [Bartonella tribocorum]|uniref:DUF3987 domain-containing protein n=1 Tax=Bartonella tribocorum TaxID=85701 RepID=UPI0024781CDF|nr:DUF3987 domain-containing protein [Bartonella tribocorum]
MSSFFDKSIIILRKKREPNHCKNHLALKFCKRYFVPHLNLQNFIVLKPINQRKERQEIEEILETLDKREKKKQAYKALKDQDEEQDLALLSQSLEHKESEEDDSSIKRHLIINDVTVEKLGELLKENLRGLLMVRDELAVFLANLERREYQTDRAFYLIAFNGDGQFTYARIGRGTIFIPNATVSIIGVFNLYRLFPFFKPCNVE